MGQAGSPAPGLPNQERLFLSPLFFPNWNNFLRKLVFCYSKFLPNDGLNAHPASFLHLLNREKGVKGRDKGGMREGEYLVPLHCAVLPLPSFLQMQDNHSLKKHLLIPVCFARHEATVVKT